MSAATATTCLTGSVTRSFRPVNDEYQPFPPVPRREYFLQRYALPLLVKSMGLPAGKRILEIGCGTGNVLVALSRLCRPSRLVGIDIDARSLEIAETNLFENKLFAELRQEDVRRLPFDDESFDVIIDLGTFFHINRRVLALKQVERVLAPGGILVSETSLNQLLSHPLRSYGKHIPWHMTPALQLRRISPLWMLRVKRSS